MELLRFYLDPALQRQNSVIIRLSLTAGENVVEVIQQFWSEFQGFQFSNEVLILFGGLLVLIGVIKIVRSSLKMFFWVFLSGLGAMSVAYGMNSSGMNLPNTDGVEISDLIGQGKELSLDVRKVLCSRWLDGEEE